MASTHDVLVLTQDCSALCSSLVADLLTATFLHGLSARSRGAYALSVLLGTPTSDERLRV